MGIRKNKLLACIVIGAGFLGSMLIKKPAIRLCSPAIDQLGLDAEAYMRNHPEDTSTYDEVFHRILKAQYGIDNVFDVPKHSRRWNDN